MHSAAFRPANPASKPLRELAVISPKDLFYLRAHLLARTVTDLSSPTPSRPATALGPCTLHVAHPPQPTAALVLPWTGVVSTHRPAPCLRAPKFYRCYLLHRHHHLRLIGRVVDPEFDPQAALVVPQRRSAQTQSGFLALRLPVPPTIRIGPAPVGGVAARLPTKVQRAMAGILFLGCLQLLGLAAVLAHEALEAGRRFNPRTIGTEVLVAGLAVRTRPRLDLRQEKSDPLGRKDAQGVRGQDTGVEAAWAEWAVQKPEPKRVVAERYPEKPLAADTGKRPSLSGLEPWLGRDAGTASFFDQLVPHGRQFPQHRIDLPLHGVERMVGRDGDIEVRSGQKLRLDLRDSTDAGETRPRP
jgi:hypothetical protein